MSKFVHLHVHSQYSLLEATAQLKPLAQKAKEFEMPALALTDNGNMFGAIEFYLYAKENGINGIIGLDAYVAPKGRFVKGEDKEVADNPYRKMSLLAMNHAGYKNLIQICSLGYREGFYYKPRIDYDLLKKYHDNLILLSGGINGEIPKVFSEIGPERALEKIRELKNIFQDRFYLELLRPGLPEWDGINSFLLEAAKITDTQVVATNDVHYLLQDDQIAQEVLICIGTNKTLHNSSRYRLGSEQFYFKTPDEMRKLFKDLPQACNNTVEIADRCKVEFKLKDNSGKPIYHLPSFPTTGGRSLLEEIKDLAYQGLNDRFEEAETRNEAVAEEDKPSYWERLKFELKVINDMGFNGYFLIVGDFINWAKSKDIPVGPGRGSGAGSLVAYSLKITDLDPVRNKLVFERFLNPERISMPDFDIDFCQDRRGEVISYVTKKYGEGSVSQIITFGKLQARAALRDVGRVLGMTFAEVDVVTKLIPEKLGINLKEAIELEPRIRELIDADPQISNLFELALKVEGLTRHAGIHAAGVIIADSELINYAPLYRGSEGENVVQYDMKHAEKIGLIKFDFLGLKTLTHIHYALGLIAKNRNKKILSQEISLSDKGIYDLICKGDTAGVFQFEGDGITGTVLKIQPNCFEDITAINALYRPGPMEMIPEYTLRKKGLKPVEYVFPELAEILKETYGIIVYQEQVQLIAARVASYSLGEADILRRAMGKKIASEMAQQKNRFIEGAKKNGFNAQKSDELFNLMEEFANYGFNKSHAAAYCVITAQTAWIKNYYPTEFFAALLTTEMSDTDKVGKYVKDAKKRGLQVKPPHINDSQYRFTVSGDDIIFGLGAIKGVGESAVENILEAKRKLPDQKFQNLEQFFENIDLRKINKKVIECLIKAGAFDNLGAHRAQLLNGYSKFVDRAGADQESRDFGQSSLFDLSPQKEDVVVLDIIPQWTRSQRLLHEKEVYGFYLTEHPLSGYEGILSKLTSGTIFEASSFSNLGDAKRPVTLAGIVTGFKEIITKKGTRMAFATLEDTSASIELVVFPNTYKECEPLLKSEKPIIVSGQLEKTEGGAKVLAEKIEFFEKRFLSSKKLLFKLDEEMLEKLEELKDLIMEYPGDIKVYYQLPVKDFNKTVIFTPQSDKGVKPTQEFIDKVHRVFGRSDFIDAL
ncbi:MAG: DNA polymerase III subunit alpha [Pseudomonadota bacterium]|nr:DNA polymerase III subunit alpha [Pseudomonadota bacterium]